MLKIYIYFLISIMVHELSHIIIAKFFKINLKNLRVSIFGASLEIEQNKKNKRIIKILMYLIGPISNLFLAIIIYYCKIPNEEKIKIIYTNLSICIFNLLPIIPLDGSNILKEILKIRFKNLKANKINFYISKMSLIILTFIYSIAILEIKNLSILVLIFYLWYLNFIEEKKIELLERTYKQLNKNLIKIENEKNISINNTCK